MVDIPFRPRLNAYRGAKENLRRKAAEENRIANKIADTLNRMVADDPDEVQQYLFYQIADKAGATVDQVRNAIGNGGWNGITFRVTPEARERLARYKSEKPLTD